MPVLMAGLLHRGGPSLAVRRSEAAPDDDHVGFATADSVAVGTMKPRDASDPDVDQDAAEHDHSASA